MPKYKSPFYQNKEEKRNFLNADKHIYLSMGYQENEIEPLINQLLEVEFFTEAEETNLDLMTDRVSAARHMSDKYRNFTGEALSEVDQILSAMYLPETSPENIRYNEQLAMKSQTRQGIAEVLQEALFRLSQITPEIMEATKNDSVLFAKHAQGLRLSFIADTLSTCIDSMMPEFRARFPEDLRDHLNNNIEYFKALSSFDDLYRLHYNRYHYLIPPNATADQLTMLYSEIGQNNAFDQVHSFRQKKAMEPSLYKPLNMMGKAPQKVEAVEDFLKDVPARIDDDRRNPKDALDRIETFGGKIHVLDEVTSLVTLNFPLDDLSEEATNIRKGNREWFRNSMPGILTHAKLNYNSPFRQAADEMVSILSSGNMLFHTNVHYAGMIKLMDSIKKLSRKGEMKDLSKEDKAQLAEKLQALKNTAEEYMKNKALDTKTYSTKAMQRMMAASFCCAFAKGRMRDLTLAMNNDLKAEFQNKVRTLDEVQSSFELAAVAYEADPTLDSFLKCLSGQKIRDFIVKNNNTPISETDARTIEETNQKMYTMLYNTDKTFRAAVNGGIYGDAVRAIVPAVKLLQKEHPQARSNDKAPIRDEPIAQVEQNNGMGLVHG